MRKAILVSLVLAAVALIAWALGRAGAPPSSASGPAMPSPSPQWCRVRGVVLDSDGAPLAGTEVRSRILDTGICFDSGPVTTDHDGGFVLNLFPPRGSWEVLARSSAGFEFGGERMVQAAPGATLEIVLREPEVSPAAERPPDIAGEVFDSAGRLVTGVPVLMVDEHGGPLATTRSGEGGRFEFRLDGKPPVQVHLEGDENLYFVSKIPRDDICLILPKTEPERAELWIGATPLTADLPDDVEVELRDTVGNRQAVIERRLSESPWRFRSVPFGVYDVVIRGHGVAGELQGFSFNESSRSAEVPVGPPASVVAAFSRPARAILVTRSPTLRPQATEFWQDDGVKGIVRGARAKSDGYVDRVEFKDLGPGKYRLKVLGSGINTVERDLELIAGQRIDLGTLELEEATGVVTLDVTDRRDGVQGGLDFCYRVTMYNRDGVRKGATLGPGEPHRARFAGLSPGLWYYRMERMLSGMGHTRHVSLDRPVRVQDGEEKTVKVDCTWRLD